MDTCTINLRGIDADKLDLAQKFDAIPINAAQTDPVDEIQRLTKGRGVDVALELIGLPLTMQQSVKALAVLGRAVIVGLTHEPAEIETYQDVLGKEAEIIGSSDHLASELPILTELVRRGELDLSDVITNTVPLDADAINETMDLLESFEGELRTVIMP